MSPIIGTRESKFRQIIDAMIDLPCCLATDHIGSWVNGGENKSSQLEFSAAYLNQVFEGNVDRADVCPFLRVDRALRLRDVPVSCDRQPAYALYWLGDHGSLFISPDWFLVR